MGNYGFWANYLKQSNTSPLKSWGVPPRIFFKEGIQIHQNSFERCKILQVESFQRLSSNIAHVCVFWRGFSNSIYQILSPQN